MSWHKHFVVSEELTKRLPPDPVDSDHPGSADTRALWPWHVDDKKAWRVGGGQGQKDRQAMNDYDD